MIKVLEKPTVGREIGSRQLCLRQLLGKQGVSGTFHMLVMAAIELPLWAIAYSFRGEDRWVWRSCHKLITCVEVLLPYATP